MLASEHRRMSWAGECVRLEMKEMRCHFHLCYMQWEYMLFRDDSRVAVATRGKKAMLHNLRIRHSQEWNVENDCMLHAIAYFTGVVSVQKRNKKKSNNHTIATVRVTRTKALNNNSKIECISNGNRGERIKSHVQHVGHLKFLQQNKLVSLFFLNHMPIVHFYWTLFVIVWENLRKYSMLHTHTHTLFRNQFEYYMRNERILHR